MFKFDCPSPRDPSFLEQYTYFHLGVHHAHDLQTGSMALDRCVRAALEGHLNPSTVHSAGSSGFPLSIIDNFKTPRIVHFQDQIGLGYALVFQSSPLIYLVFLDVKGLRSLRCTLSESVEAGLCTLDIDPWFSTDTVLYRFYRLYMLHGRSQQYGPGYITYYPYLSGSDSELSLMAPRGC